MDMAPLASDLLHTGVAKVGLNDSAIAAAGFRSGDVENCALDKHGCLHFRSDNIIFHYQH